MARQKKGSGGDPPKSRYFAGLVYPDSAPDDWRDQLKRTFGQYAISPLHQPDDDDPAPHHHVVYKHAGNITLETARRLLPSGIFKNDFLLMLHSPRIYQRYLVHLDDPDKEQFSGGRSAVDVLNGFPLDLSRDFSQEERREQKRDVFDHIREFDITEYAELIDSLSSLGFVDLLDCACCNTVLFNSYLTSKRNTRLLDNQKAEKSREVDRGLVYSDN